MKKIDLFKMSIRNLFRRKFRTVLTITGVVIGSISIILMISLGLAMDQNLKAQMAQFGDLTQIHVNAYGGGSGGVQLIDDKAIMSFEEIEHVKKAVPLIRDLNVYLILGKYRTCWNLNVYAMDEADIEALGYKVDRGSCFTEGEPKSILLGEQVLTAFTKNGKEIDWSKGEPEPIPFDMETQTLEMDIVDYDYTTGKPMLTGQSGKIKRPKTIDVHVKGMFTVESGYELANMIIIPKSLYKELKERQQDYQKALGYWDESDKKKGKNVSYEEAIIKVDEIENVTKVLGEVKNLGYSAWNDMEYLEQMEEQSKARQMALGAIGIVAFVVAAIGITNTMMMSIYERTKEIGIMKVIGAKIIDIKHMFLMEALLIGFLGGVIGATLSLILSIIMNASSDRIASMLGMQAGGCISVMTPALFVAGILFSTIVGLVSGYFPAVKATRLSALSAIRTE